MIKIAFVIDTIESPTAGTEKQLLLLLKHLNRTKFKPYLCVLRSSKWLREEFNECEIVDIGVTSFKSVSSYRKIWKFAQFLRFNSIDIVQTHFKEGNCVGVIAANLAGTKNIISTRRNQGYWHNTYKLFFLRLLNWGVTFFIANCQSTREWAINTENIEPNRIVVIHNGLDTKLYLDIPVDNKVDFMTINGFPLDSIIIGIVANLRPVKAIDVFIRAAEITSKINNNARFVIVGDGPERSVLEKMVCDRGMSDMVRFLGKREDVPELLSCIDVGALTSNSESFSNAIVEYLASGKIVVCTDVGGAREAVEDGINGYLVGPRDPVALSNAFLKAIAVNRVSMGQVSRKLAIEKFSLEAMVTATEDLYEQSVNLVENNNFKQSGRSNVK